MTKGLTMNTTATEIEIEITTAELDAMVNDWTDTFNMDLGIDWA